MYGMANSTQGRAKEIAPGLNGANDTIYSTAAWPYMSSRFPARLRLAREMRQLSQTQVAEKAGLPPSSINHFEQARRSPSFDNLRRLANALEVTTDYLLGRSDDPGLCGPVVDKVFKDAQNLTADDLENISLFVEALAKKKKAREKEKKGDQETSG
jgi:transcriptional regulator with XRE-family HTH domain